MDLKKESQYAQELSEARKLIDQHKSACKQLEAEVAELRKALDEEMRNQDKEIFNEMLSGNEEKLAFHRGKLSGLVYAQARITRAKGE